MYKFVFTMMVLSALPAWGAPCTATVHHDFDFWLGDWVVHSPDGQLQGENSITRTEEGCVLVERWRGAQGGTGRSYNYVNPTTGAWHQLWVSQGAVIDYAGGLNDSGAMVLEGAIYYQSDGREARFRGTWTPRADGSVLQQLEEYDAVGELWKPWFSGVYSRKPQ